MFTALAVFGPSTSSVFSMFMRECVLCSCEDLCVDLWVQPVGVFWCLVHPAFYKFSVAAKWQQHLSSVVRRRPLCDESVRCHEASCPSQLSVKHLCVFSKQNIIQCCKQQWSCSGELSLSVVVFSPVLLYPRKSDLVNAVFICLCHVRFSQHFMRWDSFICRFGLGSPWILQFIVIKKTKKHSTLIEIQRPGFAFWSAVTENPDDGLTSNSCWTNNTPISCSLCFVLIGKC